MVPAFSSPMPAVPLNGGDEALLRATIGLLRERVPRVFDHGAVQGRRNLPEVTCRTSISISDLEYIRYPSSVISQRIFRGANPDQRRRRAVVVRPQDLESAGQSGRAADHRALPVGGSRGLVRRRVSPRLLRHRAPAARVRDGAGSRQARGDPRAVGRPVPEAAIETARARGARPSGCILLREPAPSSTSRNAKSICESPGHRRRRVLLAAGRSRRTCSRRRPDRCERSP